MATNKLFEKSEFLQKNDLVSRVRVNREYLISKHTADDLNTYMSFTPFATFNDLFAPEYDANGEEVTPDSKGSGTLGVRSLFNRAGAVILGSRDVKKMGEVATAKTSPWRISNNVPLMDNRASREAIKEDSGCSVKELVKASEDGVLGRETYAFSDFMYCKYLGRVPNNYLITLRRFPYPVDDFISAVGTRDMRKKPEFATQNADSIGCMVTWLGTPGNEMSNVLKYTVSMPFKTANAQLQDNKIDADAGGGPANAISALFDSKYREQYMAGQAGTVVNKYIGGIFPNAAGDPPYPASQWNSFRDSSKVYGPVDVIKETYMRSEEGLKFDQDISIVFDYELRSYNGINGRQAMLDLLANVLNVTYSTGTFWGGGYRGGGAHQNNVFANMKVFKTKGGFTDFVEAFAEDLSNLGQKAKSSIESNGGILETIKKIGNSLGGMLAAGFLNKMGRPQKQQLNSLLSPAPIGFWHLTIGNPHHPIMSMGNMILKSAQIEHYGPLGLDDFPTGLKVTCTLTRGKPRDIRDIEKLYMKGNDRIYSPMGPKIFDMYKNAKEYKSGDKSRPLVGNASSTVTAGGQTETISNLGELKHVIQKYFGHVDTQSIMVASMEQEMGAGKKQKKGTAGGDSTKQGNKSAWV